ncbi:hypothetical protein [Enterococcus sp. AZ192]|uniref:hypothetical protein n=1 Tax=unclassified Enterococcus TaxID=2608891 RepID=UPI003D29BE43
MEEQNQIIELGEKTMDQIAKRLHKLNLAEKKKIRDNAYHNTKMLLSNYKLLKSHCEIINEQITDDLLSGIWGDDRLQLTTLLENKAKTSKLMDHVDRALIEYKEQNPRGYDMLKMKYLNDAKLSDMDISIEYKIDRSRITRKVSEYINQFSIILFGAEVLLSDF